MAKNTCVKIRDSAESSDAAAMAVKLAHDPSTMPTVKMECSDPEKPARVLVVLLRDAG